MNNPPTIEALDIPDLLANLVERSLVLFDQKTGRYHMPETMRAFALEQLGEEQPETKRRHFNYFAQYALEIRAEEEAAHEGIALQMLESEADNYRSAFEFGFAHDAKRTLAMAAKIGFIWYRFQATESIRLVQSALAAAPDANDRDHLSAETMLAQKMIRTSSDPSKPEQYLLRAMQRLEHMEAPDFKALVLLRLSVVERMRGESEKGLQLALEALEIARQVGNANLIASACMHLGEHSRGEGKFAEAIHYYQEALRQPTISNSYRELGAMNLGATALEQNDLDSAERYYRESVAIVEAAGATAFDWHARDGLGYVFIKRGDFRRGGLVIGYGIHRRSRRSVALTLEDARLQDEMLAYGRAKGGEEFEAAFKEGMLLNEEQVMELIRA